MNIFSVLSQGASRLHEPSMSAMLGYLLGSNHDHGLGDTFVRAFLRQLDAETFAAVLEKPEIKSSVEFEPKYELTGVGDRSLDIDLLILDKEKVLFRVLIENKIRGSAANPRQLADFYAAVMEDAPKTRNLYFVFLTPELKQKALTTEFSNLVVSSKMGHYAKRMYWDSSTGGVLPIIRDIMRAEMVGDINPINDYMRHTLKAFIRHAAAYAKPAKEGSNRGEDIGAVTEELTIGLKNGSTYRVVMRDSSQIQVFDDSTGDKQVARRILGQYIDENRLPIDHMALNTRGIGKQLFKLKMGG